MTTIDEVFNKHQDLLLALMDTTPRPGPGEFPALQEFLPMLRVLDVYAKDLDPLDKIIYQPHVMSEEATGDGV